MSLTVLLQACLDNPEHVLVPAEWGQGRATFGGLVAAMIYHVMRAKVPLDKPVRSLSINFVGPLLADEPFSLNVEILREGKSVTQVLGRAIQNGQTAALIIGSFGSARSSQIQVSAASAPTLRAPENCQTLPYIQGLTPEFTRFIDLQFAEGGLPFSNRPEPTLSGWVRLRDELIEPLDEAHLLVLVDAWPPVPLAYLKAPAPSSSLAWTIEFIQPLTARSSQDWYMYRAQLEHAADGYAQIGARLWTAEGELIAISRQTSTVFA